MARSRMEAPRLAALSFLALLGGCSEERRDITEPEGSEATFAAILSDPVQSPGQTAAGSLIAAQAASPAAAGDVVYVSLPPGTIPEGERIAVRSLRTGFARTEPLVDGGLDPVSVPAAVGDQLELVATLSGGATRRSVIEVPARRRPRVVRTVPPRGKTDVPLNARIVVVFSEPLDPQTLSTASVQLLRGTVPVTGRLEFLDADHVTVEFIPNALLAPATRYRLEITQEVRDLDGEPLEVPVTVDFETGFPPELASSLELTSASSGTDLDPNGYTVAVEGQNFSSTVSLPINSKATVSGMRSGDYRVTLGGVAGNCDVTGQNPRTVSVPAGTLVPLAFEVACGPVTRLAFVSNRDGNAEIYAINSNGTDAVRLTANPASDLEPAWSPDGAKVAFTSDRGGNKDVYLMNADGSGLARITTSAAADYYPTWSSDGSKIAFASERDGNAEIYVINGDGTNLVRLTHNLVADVDPAWSPDGSKIAFATDRDGNREVYVMNADGSGVIRLTSNETYDFQPAWSPDGAKLAFSREMREQSAYAPRIVVMNADGSGITQLTFSYSGQAGAWAETHADPAWSPDGRRIAFTSFTCDYSSICYSFFVSVMSVRTDATNLAEVVNSGPFPLGAAASNPSWRR